MLQEMYKEERYANIFKHPVSIDGVTSFDFRITEAMACTSNKKNDTL